MITAFVFTIMALIFGALAYNGYTTGEIHGKGWFGSIRIYSRDAHPGMFWATFYLFVAIACISLGMAVIGLVRG